jgi:signal transduction histidine kinase
VELILSLTTFIISLALALFVYYKNSKSGTQVYLSALILCIGLYPLFNYLSLHSTTDASSFFWAKFILFVAIPVGPLFYFSVSVFPSPKFIFSKKTQVFFIMWAVLNYFLAAYGLIFQSVHITGIEQVTIQPGPAVASFGLMQITGILAGSLILIKKYRNSTGLLRLQLRYITFGIIISFGLNLLATVIFPLGLNISLLIPISPFFLLIAVVSITYSVVRHRLLDIRFIVARSVAYSLLVLVMGVFYASALSLVGTFVFKNTETFEDLISSAFFAILIVFSFQPLRRLFEKYTDEVFYRDNYNAEELLGKLGRIMSSTLILSTLSDLVLKEVFLRMKISFGYMILIRDDKIIWTKEEGTKERQNFDEEKICKVIASIVQTPGENIMIFEELDEFSQYKQLLRNSHISVVLPLTVNDETIGALLLGEKSSGDVYSTEDVNMLKILAPEVAVAVKNALSYEEIRRFNETLKDKVARATSDLQQANEHLKQLDHLKDEFVSLASHELRTPMTVVKSYLWMVLQDKKGKLNSQQKLYLERAFTASDGLINLVNDMLNVSRIESGRFSIEKQDTDVKDLIQTTVTELGPEAKKMGLSLVFHLESKDFPTSLSIDPERIKQVVINLIGNSLKFTPKNGKITVALSKSDAKVIIKVIDNGVGISKENVAKLFQKFGLLRESYQKSGTQGTGLGLYISKSIIELHGGKIWAESEGEGKGTTFTFTLPIK